MTGASPLRTDEVLALRRALGKGDGDRMTALRRVFGRPIRSPRALREWHDLLLFLLAHPHDVHEYKAVTQEIQRMAGIACEWVRGSERQRHALINSGLEGAPLQSIYTFRLVHWMLTRWPASMEVFIVEADLDEFKGLLGLLLSPAEAETVDQAYEDALQLLDAVYGPDRVTQLHRLVEGLCALPVLDTVRELLWARMQVYVKLEGASGFGLTFSRCPMGVIHFLPAGLQRGVDIRQVVDVAVGPAVRLSAEQQAGLIDTARTVLATLHRETDPVTHAGAVELFDMGRGLRIALFHLDVAHRLPFDSYVGFMAFRNGIPMAYGGAWIFPGRSKVGINVFPALRGGESAWFFAQLLRLYRQRFGVDRFEAENYQLGHQNPDGLRSGAYWFYYRLGFRPTTRSLQQVAEREFRKLGDRTGYQVPIRLLKELVENGLELVIADTQASLTDTAALTMAVQQFVVTQYGGDRRKAMRTALQRLGRVLPLGDLADWAPDERAALYLWALPLDMVDGFERWSVREKRSLVELVRSKGAATETIHQARLGKHHSLLRAWSSCTTG